MNYEFRDFESTASSECGVDDTCQIWCMTNRIEVIKILVNFGFSSAAILDFEKWRFWHFRCLEGFQTKLHAKFGENRTNGSGVIQVFVNFKMTAGGHLGL